MKRTRKLFGLFDMFCFYVVHFALIETRYYLELRLFAFKWGCYVERKEMLPYISFEGLRIWD